MIKLALIRAAWGAALLLAPQRVLRTVDARRSDARTRCVTQVLGARELMQAMLAVRHRPPWSSLDGAAVDASHAATMLALAIWRPAYRRPAAASALAAVTFAITGLRTGSENSDPPVQADSDSRPAGRIQAVNKDSEGRRGEALIAAIKRTS